MILRSIFLGARLMAKRMLADMSREEVAVYLGCDAAELEQWELGRARPTAEQLQQLAELFGCDVPEFRRGREPSLN